MSIFQTILKISETIRRPVLDANPGKTIYTDDIQEILEFKEKLLEELISMNISEELINEMCLYFVNDKFHGFNFVNQTFNETRIGKFSKNIRDTIRGANPMKTIYTADIQQVLEPKQALLVELVSMNLSEEFISKMLTGYINHTISIL